MEKGMTPGAVLANINGWTFNVGGCENRYKLKESEADAIKPVLQRNQLKKRIYTEGKTGCKCPTCGGDIANIDVFCRWCGQRVEES